MNVAPALAAQIALLPLLARIVGFMLVAPPFSTKLAPRSVKIGFAIVLWICVSSQNYAMPIDSLVASSIAELLAGWMLGFMVQILFSAFDLIGELLSSGMGLSFPGDFDPVAQQSSGPVAGLVQLLAISIFISASGMETLTSYLLESYSLLPIGAPPNFQAFESNVISLLTNCMLLGLTSSLAIWGSLLIANILMLVASRLSGGLNLMSSGLPLLLIIGLTLLAYALMPSLTHLWAKLPAQGISLFAPK